MVGEDLSLSQLPMVCPIGSWADAGGSLSLDGADARVSNLISCFGRRLGISGSGRMASPETQNSFVDISGSILLIYLAAVRLLFLAGGGAVTPTPQVLYSLLMCMSFCDCLTT